MSLLFPGPDHGIQSPFFVTKTPPAISTHKKSPLSMRGKEAEIFLKSIIFFL